MDGAPRVRPRFRVRQHRLLAVVVLVVTFVFGFAPLARASYRGSMGQIAYLGSMGRLMVDDPLDTSPPRELVPAQPTGMYEGGLPFSAPTWSPDGTKIAYTELVKDPVPDAPEPVYHGAVFTIDQDGTGRVQVTHPHDFRPNSCNTCDDGGYWADWSPTWSPDRSKIAFIRLTAVGTEAIDWSLRGYNIWVANASGGGEQQLTRAGDDEVYASVIWSPDGSRLAAMRGSKSSGALELVTLSPTGGGATVIGGNSAWSDYDWTPDGMAIVATRNTGDGFEVVRIDATTGAATTLGTTSYGALVRSTTDGNGAMYRDCQSPPGDCGLYVRRFDDPGGDVFSDEPLERRWAANPPSLPPTGPLAGSRSPFDIQPQQLPVIFVPGFLGSEITCDAGMVWPKPAGNPMIDFTSMNLDIDGSTNAGCASARPTGNAVMTFDIGPKSEPVYGPTVEHMATFTDSDGNPRGYVYGWDWRKAPQQSLAGLDALITQALATGVPAREGATRVVLYGHSYGGLLIRTYIDDPARAQRVARVLTVGTPYWGSPKTIFPLAYGIELPEPGSGLDWFSDNTELHSFAQNLAGLYQLYPSDSFGPWLKLNGVWLDQAGVQQEVLALGGNPALWAKARQNHQQLYDHFFDDGGRIDVRVVVGTGVPTFGTIDLMTNSGQVRVGYVNGDHTVPATSATQDPNPNAEHPAGDPGGRVHVQRICNVEHMAESSSANVLTAYDEFLDYGHRPRRTEGLCAFSGFEMLFNAKAITSASARPASQTLAGALTIASATPMTLADAALAGLIDVARVPGQWIVATSDRDPVMLTLNATDLTLELGPISDAGSGARLRYGPMSGSIQIQPASSPGQPPTVTDDGTVITPQPVDELATPQVRTDPASSVTANMATANAIVNPENQATSYHFDYGTSVSYGSRVPATDAAAGSDKADHAVAQPLTGLTPNTTYHYRVVATNTVGTSYGNDQTFTTMGDGSSGGGTGGGGSSGGGSGGPTTAPDARVNGRVGTLGTLLKFTFACHGAAGQKCQGQATATAIEKLSSNGKTITGVLSSKPRTGRYRIVVVAQGNLSAAAGASSDVSIRLNSTGQRLRSKFKNVPADMKVTATAAGKTTTIRTTRVTFGPDPPTLSIAGAPATKRTTVAASLRCKGQSDQLCRAAAQITTFEQLGAGGKITGLSYSPSGRGKTVTLATVSYAVKAGHALQTSIEISRTGKGLLARFGRVPATLKLTPNYNGYTLTPLTAKITFKR